MCMTGGRLLSRLSGPVSELPPIYLEWDMCGPFAYELSVLARVVTAPDSLRGTLLDTVPNSLRLTLVPCVSAEPTPLT